MTFTIYSDIGGFFWWLLIKFCKTELKEEQSEKHWARNIFVLIFIVIILMGISVSFFDN